MGVKIRRSLNISWQIYDDSVYIYDERNEFVSKLEDAGLLFWNCLDNSENYDEILAEIAVFYNKNTDDIKDLLEEFVDELVEVGFIERIVI